jgi:hypothetical protein
MCSVKGDLVVEDMDLLDTHALFGTLDAEFENECSELLYTRVKPFNVEDIAEYHDLQRQISSLRISDTSPQTCIASW